VETDISNLLDELLLQTAQVSNLGQPSRENLDILQRWLKQKTGGNHFLRKIEFERTWSKEVDDKKDLVCLMQSDTSNKDISQRFRPWAVASYDYVTRKLPVEWIKRRRVYILFTL
jgi:hypothetical protein